MRVRLIFAHCIPAQTASMDEMNPMQEIKILWIGGNFMQQSTLFEDRGQALHIMMA